VLIPAKQPGGGRGAHDSNLMVLSHGMDSWNDWCAGRAKFQFAEVEVHYPFD